MKYFEPHSITKITLLSVAILFLTQNLTFAAPIVSWNDLELDKTYLLNEPIEFSEGNSTITLPTHGSYQFIDQIPLDEIRVQAFLFKWLDCPPELENRKLDMIMVDHNRYGVLVEPGCQLEVYLENADLPRSSLFLLNENR